MRVTILAFLFGFTSIVSAQISADMQEAISCMHAIDETALESLSKPNEKFVNEIKALCEKGDESGARKAAMKHMKEERNNETFMQIKKCSEMMKKAMPEMQTPEKSTPEKSVAEVLAEEKGNICDYIL